MVFNTPDHVQARITDNYDLDGDEYSQTKCKAGEIADKLAKFIIGKDCKTISRPNTGLVADGVLNFETRESILSHKIAALLGGLGWIGKNNLLVTPEYDTARCLGTVLADALLETALHEPLTSKCGNCITCVNIRKREVLEGKVWSRSVSRDEIANIHGRNTCLKCLVYCPRAQTYIERDIV